MDIEVGQKVYVIDVSNNITESTIEKITRSLVTLSNGKIFRNDTIWLGDYRFYYYTSKLDGYDMVLTKENAEYFVKHRKFDNFNVNSYRNIKYPTKPSTPRMSSTSPTKEEIAKYQKAMEEFEAQMKVFTEETSIANNKMHEWMDTYMAYLAYKDGLDVYSEEIRSAVYSMAYDAGHSSGYCEVANYHSTFAEFAIKVIELSKK
jgi:hypothetical protein